LTYGLIYFCTAWCADSRMCMCVCVCGYLISGLISTPQQQCHAIPGLQYPAYHVGRVVIAFSPRLFIFLFSPFSSTAPHLVALPIIHCHIRYLSLSVSQSLSFSHHDLVSSPAFPLQTPSVRPLVLFFFLLSHKSLSSIRHPRHPSFTRVYVH